MGAWAPSRAPRTHPAANLDPPHPPLTPRQLGAPAAVADYVRLMQECWHE
jgi:hypothetical protein